MRIRYHIGDVGFVSVKEAKEYMKLNRHELFKGHSGYNKSIGLYQGLRRYGTYILVNDNVIEVEKGDFRK